MCGGGDSASQAERQDYGQSDSSESTHGIAIHVPSPQLDYGYSGAGRSRPPEPSPCSHPQTGSGNERSLIRGLPVRVDLFYIADEPSGKLGIRAVGAELQWQPVGVVFQIRTANWVRIGRVDLLPLDRFLRPRRKLRTAHRSRIASCLNCTQRTERLRLRRFLKQCRRQSLWPDLNIHNGSM